MQGATYCFHLVEGKDEIMSFLRHVSKGIICHDHFTEELVRFQPLCNSHWIKYCVPQTLIKGVILFCTACHTECFFFEFIDSTIFVLGFLNLFILLAFRGDRTVAQCLRCCATNRKVAGSIPTGVSGFFIDIKFFRSHYGPGVDSASNINEYQEYFLGVKADGAYGWNLTTILCRCHEFWEP